MIVKKVISSVDILIFILIFFTLSSCSPNKKYSGNDSEEAPSAVGSIISVIAVKSLEDPEIESYNFLMDDRGMIYLLSFDSIKSIDESLKRRSGDGSGNFINTTSQVIYVHSGAYYRLFGDLEDGDLVFSATGYRPQKMRVKSIVEEKTGVGDSQIYMGWIHDDGCLDVFSEARTVTIVGDAREISGGSFERDSVAGWILRN